MAGTAALPLQDQLAYDEMIGYLMGRFRLEESDALRIIRETFDFGEVSYFGQTFKFRKNGATGEAWYEVYYA
jgi:hypothetical protein